MASRFVVQVLVERGVMPILLWIVFPFAVWSACMDQVLSVVKPSHTPKEIGG